MTTISVDIQSAIQKAKKGLLRDPVQVNYLDTKDMRSNELPSTLGQDPVNIYAIWERTEPKAPWQLRYVGQRHQQFGWQRVMQHLFWTPPGTASKLEDVRKALQSGSDIGVTAILVQPNSMRLAIEEELINDLSQEGRSLWNRHSVVSPKKAKPLAAVP